jgi:hypothetical protein
LKEKDHVDLGKLGVSVTLIVPPVWRRPWMGHDEFSGIRGSKADQKNDQEDNHSR